MTSRTSRSTGTLLVLAKAPRPGLGKTRLAPASGPDGAAALAAAAPGTRFAAALRALRVAP